MEIDMNKIAAELGIDQEVVLELLKEYLKEADGLIGKLEGSLASGDYAVLISTAHTLKGSSGNLRMTPIQEAARAVELSGKEKKDKASIEALVASLKALHEELRTILGKM